MQRAQLGVATEDNQYLAELPIEVLLMILSSLPIEDALKLGSVNKQLRLKLKNEILLGKVHGRVQRKFPVSSHETHRTVSSLFINMYMHNYVLKKNKQDETQEDYLEGFKRDIDTLGKETYHAITTRIFSKPPETLLGILRENNQQVMLDYIYSKQQEAPLVHRLEMAIMCNQSADVINSLIDSDVNYFRNKVLSSISSAIKIGNSEIVATLIAKLSRDEKEKGDGGIALREAVYSKNLQMLQFLLAPERRGIFFPRDGQQQERLGAFIVNQNNPDALRLFSNFYFPNMGELLEIAVCHNNVAMLQQLISMRKGAKHKSVNVIDAIYAAAKEGSVEALTFLLGQLSASGRDEISADYTILQALEASKEVKDIAIVKIIEMMTQNKKEKEFARINDSALVGAVTKKRPEVVKFLLDQGANPNRRAHSILDALKYNKNTKNEVLTIFIYLLSDKNKHSLNITPESMGVFQNLFFTAIEEGNLTLIDLLLKKGVDYKVQGKDPLAHAIQSQQDEVVKLLIHGLHFNSAELSAALSHYKSLTQTESVQSVVLTIKKAILALAVFRDKKSNKPLHFFNLKNKKIQKQKFNAAVKALEKVVINGDNLDTLVDHYAELQQPALKHIFEALIDKASREDLKEKSIHAIMDEFEEVKPPSSSGPSSSSS